MILDNKTIRIDVKIADQANNGQRAIYFNEELSHHLDEDQLQIVLDDARGQFWNDRPSKGKIMGQKLWQLFNGSARVFEQKVKQAYRQGKKLQLHFDLPYQLDALPIEILHDDEGFLLLGEHTHVFRQVDNQRNREEEYVVEKRRLRLVFMAASPQDAQGVVLDYEKEEEQIFTQTERLPIDLQIEDSGSLAGLREKLRELDGCDVLHLSGHAMVHYQRGPVFVMEDDMGKADLVTPAQLWQAIRDYPPKLLFLSGCETGKSDKVNHASSFAFQMVQQGCPLVLGWGMRVNDQGATQMTQILYKYLAEGKPLDFALTRAREVVEKDYHPWPLLRLMMDATPLKPLIASGQLRSRKGHKPAQVTHKILQNSDVQILETGFVGRRRSLQQGMRVLLGEVEDKYGLLVTGAAGVGKSCLVGKLLERFSSTHEILVLSRHLTHGKLLASFRELFTRCGYATGIAVLDDAELGYKEKIYQLFRTVFEQEQILMYWDNFEDNLEQVGNQHQFATGVTSVITPFLEALTWAKGNTQLLISSRYPFVYEVDGLNKVQALEAITLMAMRGTELKKKIEGLTHIHQSPQAQLYIDIGKGNPRLLDWLEVIARGEAALDLTTLKEKLQAKSEEYISEYLAEILARTQGEDFLSFLRKSSVYRQPVPAVAYKGLAQAYDKWVITAQGLTLMECDNTREPARYWIHPVLQTRFWESLEKGVQQELHLEALGAYERIIDGVVNTTIEDCEEGYYHALTAREYLRACLPAVFLSKSLESNLLYEQSAKMLEDILIHITPKEEQKTVIAKEDLLAVCYNNLGSLYGYLGNQKKSEDYLEKSLELREQIYGTNHPEVGTSYNNLGITYLDLGSYQKSLDYLQKGLHIRQISLGKTDPQVAVSYDNIATVYMQLGEYKEALEYQLKSLEILEGVGDGKKTAINYGNVAVTYQELGDYEKALDYTIKALEIDRVVFGEKHIDIAKRMNNLGAIYIELNDLKKAQEYMEKSLAIRQEIFAVPHQDLVSSYTNLGVIYRTTNPTKALQYLQKALTTQQEIAGNEHPNLVLIINNIGLLYKDAGDYEKAIEHAKRALKLGQKLFGAEHPDIAIVYNNLGEIYTQLGDYVKSRSYHQKVLDFRLREFGENHSHTALTYNNLAVAYGELGEQSKALVYLTKALKVQKQVFGELNPQTANTHSNLGMLYWQMGNFEQSLVHNQQALQTRQELPINNPYEVAASYSAVGAAHGKIGNTTKALEYLEIAILLSIQNLGLEHPKTEMFLGNLIGMLRDMGKGEEEIKVYLEEMFSHWSRV